MDFNAEDYAKERQELRKITGGLSPKEMADKFPITYKMMTNNIRFGMDNKGLLSQNEIGSMNLCKFLMDYAWEIVDLIKQHPEILQTGENIHRIQFKIQDACKKYPNISNEKLG